MPIHRFKVGDWVRVVGADDAGVIEAFIDRVALSHADRSQDEWEVIRLLPPDQCGFQYHIKRRRDDLTRLVHERQLEAL
jgi:hypothetical protein